MSQSPNSHRAKLADQLDAFNLEVVTPDRAANALATLMSQAADELRKPSGPDREALQKERDRFVLDVRRLDWLDQQGDPGIGWVARKSTTGRGYRLHQDSSAREHGYVVGNSPRDAIDKVMEAKSAATQGEQG